MLTLLYINPHAFHICGMLKFAGIVFVVMGFVGLSVRKGWIK